MGFATNGEQAMNQFKSFHPELILKDYLLPDKNGIEILMEIIQCDTRAHVIMIPGTHGHTIEEKAHQAGAKVFIEKHCSPSKLLKVINQVEGT